MRKEVKAIILIVLVLILVVAINFIFKPEHSDDNGLPLTDLSLIGTVKHDYYQSIGYGYSSLAMSEYAVSITVTNQGEPVTYDIVKVYFDRGDGQGLTASRQVLDEEEQPIESTLGTGQIDEIDVGTNGYTMDILQHTETGRVALHVAFLYNGETIDEFHAVLPSLIIWDDKPAELPLWEEVPLDFTRDYDKVMEQVRG